MIYYCEFCDKYWMDDTIKFIWDWVYCLSDGTQLRGCPDCTKKGTEK